MPRDPQSLAEWQNAVDTAYGLLGLDSARAYGLVAGGPTIVVSRCEEIIERGKTLGITPSDDALETVALAYASDDGA